MEGLTQNFVDHPAQEIQQTNPIEKNRRPTDRLFIFVFPLIIIAWLAIGISGLCSDHTDMDKDKVRTFQIFQAIINAPFTSFSYEVVIALVLSTGFILLCIFLNKKFTKFFVYLGMGIYMLGTISTIAKFIFGGTKDDTLRGINIPVVLIFYSIISWVGFLLQTIFMVASVASFFKVDQNVLCSIIKDFCGVVLGRPLIIFFTCFISILGYIVYSFTMNALVCDVFSDRNVYHIAFDSIALMFGGMCALSFVYNFGLMVVSEYTVNYYWKNDEATIGQSIIKILRNHIGSIMFSSTFFVPSICAIVQALKHQPSWKNKDNYIFYFVSKVSLALNMPSTALIFSSIYGTGFVKSSQKAFDTVLRRCLLYLATLGVVDAVIAMIAIVVLILGIIMTAVLQTHPENEDKEQILISLVLVLPGLVYPLVTFLLLICYSARALLINKIIMLNDEDKYTEGKTEILNRL